MQNPANIMHTNSPLLSPTFEPFLDELHIPSINFVDFLNDPGKIPQLPGYEVESDAEYVIPSEEQLKPPQQISRVSNCSSDVSRNSTLPTRILAGGISILIAFLCLHIFRLAPNVIPWRRDTDLLTRLRHGMNSDNITSVQHSSENIVQSMKELCLEMDRQAIDTLPLQEISGLLRLQPNLRGSFVTSVILWDLSDAVKSVADKLRQLHGKGHTEMGLLTQSILLLKHPNIPIKLQIPQEILDQTLYVFNLLKNVANSTLHEIRLTVEANQFAKENLFQIERALRASLKSWRIPYLYGSQKYHASGLLLKSTRLAINHTGEIATYLHNTRRMIQLYHDNAQSWLDMAQRRLEASRNSVDGSAMQCLLLLNTLDEHVLSGQVEKPLLAITRNAV